MHQRLNCLDGHMDIGQSPNRDIVVFIENNGDAAIYTRINENVFFFRVVNR